MYAYDLERKIAFSTKYDVMDTAKYFMDSLDGNKTRMDDPLNILWFMFHEQNTDLIGHMVDMKTVQYVLK